MLQHSIVPSLPFEIWEINFIDLFPKRAKQTGEKYIITIVEYLTRWVEVELFEIMYQRTSSKNNI